MSPADTLRYLYSLRPGERVTEISTYKPHSGDSGTIVIQHGEKAVQWSSGEIEPLSWSVRRSAGDLTLPAK